MPPLSFPSIHVPSKPLLYWVVMTKMKQIRKSDHPVYKLLGLATKQYLEKADPQIIDLIDDSYKIHEQFKSNDSAFEDFSFIVTPAFKALEKWLFLIAPSLGIPSSEIEAVRDKSVGTLIGDQDRLSDLFENVLSTIDAAPQTKNDLSMEVMSLKSFLRNYRHKIAHCWKTLELPSDAFTHQTMIVGSIRRITEKLLEVKLLTAI
jgi:hypothetical protein